MQDKKVLFNLLKTEAQKLVGNLNSLDKFADKEAGRQKIRMNVATINELLSSLDVLEK